MKEKNNIWNWFKSYFTNVVVETISTPVNPSLQVCMSEGKYILHSAADNYSYTSLDRAFYKLFMKMELKNRAVNKVLILGVGSGSLISTLVKDFKLNAVITGIEKDEEVIRVSKKYFNISDHKNFTLVHADAYKYLETHTETYDLVVSEIFSGHHVPDEVESTSYLKHLKKALAPGALLVFSEIIADKETKKSAKKLVDKFESVFGKAKVNKIWEFWRTWMITFENNQED